MNLPVKQPLMTSLLMDPDAFNHMQRVGGMLALSPLFPEHLRKGTKETAIANGVLVMNMAARLQEDPLTVAQNIYFVSGKPGWSTAYMIAKANQHGVFSSPIDWKITGSGDSLSVTAFATLTATGRDVSATVDMAMAKAENWVKNPKYKSMPETMFRYRSAAFLIRFYCPEVMVGIPSQVEVELEARDVTPNWGPRDVTATNEAPVDGDVVEAKEETKPEPKQERKLDAETTAKPEPDTNQNDEQEQGQPETQQEEKPEPTPADHRNTLNMILRDLNDAGNTDAVVKYYSDAGKINELKQHAPDLFAELKQHVEEFRKAEAQGDS